MCEVGSRVPAEQDGTMEITNTVVASFVAYDLATRTVALIPIVDVPTVDAAGEPVGAPVDLTATFAALAEVA